MATAPDSAEKSLCFVIGPIGKEGTETRRDADFLLEMIIRPALADSYRVKRADEDADPGMISNAMITDITHAEIVVADLTGLNPNAFYELGIRHMTEQPVIHVATVGTELPFDALGHRTIFFDLRDHRSISITKDRISDAARATKEPGYHVSNPIIQANAIVRMRDSDDPQERAIADLQARIGGIESELRDQRIDRERRVARSAAIRERIRTNQRSDLDLIKSHAQ